MHISTPQAEKPYDTKLLYEEFKSFLKAPSHKKPRHKVEVQYKKLYSSLKIANAEKKLILSKRQNAQNNIKKNGCRFQKLESYQSLTAWKQSQILSDSILNNEDGDEVLNKVLLQDMFKSQLEEQIDNLKTSLSETRKKLTETKGSIKKLDIKQSKFLQARHLAQSIEQHTKQVSLINMKNYKNMIEEQEEILKNFKKMKGNFRKQLQQSEIKYHSEKKEYQIKFKKLKECNCPLEQQKKQTTKLFKVPRGYKKFLQHLEKVLTILKEKESDYQNIKQSECTRNIFKKLDLSVLSQERAQWFRIVQGFEEKFEMKLESTQKLIVKLFKMLKCENEDRQKKIFQFNHFYEECQQEYCTLIQKQKQFYSACDESELIKMQREKEMNKKKKSIKNNSKLFIQYGQLFSSLLAKFRYVFKLFMVMNVDKKIYNQQILKLDTVLQSKDLNYCKFNRGNRLQIIHEDTNPKEIQQIMHTYFPNLQSSHMNDIIYLFFNDLRIALSCKRYLLMDEIDECKGKNDWGSLLKVMMNLKHQSEKNYLQKIKELSNVLKDCLKAAYKGKMKESQKDIDVPFKMFSNTKLLQDYDMEKSERISSETSAKLKWTLDFANKEIYSEKIEKWGDQSRKNPNQMIRNLLKIKSQNQKKFKLLDLGVNTNTILFQTYKQNNQDKKYPKILKNIHQNNFIQ